ncbi:oil body-associated protein 2B-like [Ananas comosus]|uniref:Oil body-associated protein 2B-like n=1 Tax=Ananas comosus TaxID=4615 RepID=A0A6P5GJ87_ANACO|nr:oil body-associated protein 2B-like [Ananas comosus]
MASSGEKAGPRTAVEGGEGGGGSLPPGRGTTVGSHVLDKGAAALQALRPVRQMKQHACSFALYAHDLARQVEAHHYAARLNQDFLQCAVYDSPDSAARLVGVEYIVSDRIFETLPPEEQKLWHSHAYEIKSGLWTNPGVPEMLQRPELANLAKTYGKFWCTWQVDRGDRLPLGAPALMMSPQAVDLGKVRPELVRRRDEKLGISTEDLRESRVEMEEPEWINPNADYWKQHGKGFAVDAVPTEMKRTAPFP